MVYNEAMEALKQIVYTFVYTVTSLVPALLQGAFTIKDSIDTAKDQYTAAVLGVPVWVITAIGIAITIVGGIFLVIKLIRWLNK